METTNLDTIRVNIFRELINLDGETLKGLYAYIHTLAIREKAGEERLLQELLISNAEYAVEAHRRGETYTSGEVMDYIDQELGWK